MKKNQAAIDETKDKFDEFVVALFERMLKYEFAILQEDLKIWKMKTSMLLEKDMHNYEAILETRSHVCEDRASEVTSNIISMFGAKI